jgi:hypothetical protein
MPELRFEVLEARPAPHCAAPTLYFRLAARQAEPAAPIGGVALHCQIRIEPDLRPYEPEEQSRLSDLFGAPSGFGQRLQSLLWTHATVNIPPFTLGCEADLPVPCSFDFDVAATKYFAGLDGGSVPLLFLFSGSVFYRGAGGALAMDAIPWNREATFRLPVRAWRELMELYYPNSAWLRLDREVFQSLYDYKRRHCHPDFDRALASLLSAAEAAAP